MSKGDNRRRTTRELDAVQLAALTKESKQPDAPKVPTPRAAVPSTHDHPVIALGRTTTLDDPFTTGLLAEVARRSQTQEFDEDLLAEIQAALEKDERKSG